MVGVFDIMGPIMIGPSSSHTAGAAKIGRMAYFLFGEQLEEVAIYLHGSFAETYQGHGTDRALVGGLLGFKPDDERIRDSLSLALRAGIKISLDKISLRDAHPNTVLLVLKGQGQELSLLGSSLGGGNIIISRIDNYQVNLSGRLPSLWILHADKPGEVGIITSILGRHQINIAFMQVFRKKKGSIGSSIIELDEPVGEEILRDLKKETDIYQVRYLPPLNL